MLYCSRDGECDVTSIKGYRCQFCRLNKCYNYGMEYSRVRLYDIHYIRRQLRNYEPSPPPTIDGKLSWRDEEFINYLLYMEQHYYQWLNLSPAYASLSGENKKILKKRSLYRGITLQLIERSIRIHDMLWLHKCFYDPYLSQEPLIRSAAIRILNFSIYIKEKTINWDTFNAMKLKLALDKVVIIENESDIPLDFHFKINAIAKQLAKCHDNHIFSPKNFENPEKIEGSGLFNYPDFPDMQMFPEHIIVLK